MASPSRNSDGTRDHKRKHASNSKRTPRRSLSSNRPFWKKEIDADSLSQHRIEGFSEAVDAADFQLAMDILSAMSITEVDSLKTDRALLARITDTFDLLDSIALLDVFGRGTVDPLMAFGGLRYGEEFEFFSSDDDKDRLDDPEEQTQEFDEEELRAGLADQALFADDLKAAHVPVFDQLELTGVLDGNPDWQMFFRILHRLGPKDRRTALTEVRSLGLWRDLLNQMDFSSIALVQGWLEESLGDGSSLNIETRIKASPNPERGLAVLERIDAIAATGRNDLPRLTPRLRELLALGVSLSRLPNNPLTSRGTLGILQAERAGRALSNISDQHYLRFLLLLEMTGTRSRLNQSFLLLKALSARALELADPDEATGTMEDIENFADEIREKRDQELVASTTVLQTDPEMGPGLQQRFTVACNVTSAIVIRTEADPMEALRIHQENQCPAGQLQGHIAGETEESLIRHGSNQPVTRDPSLVRSAVFGALEALTGTIPLAQIAAVRDYIMGRPHNAHDYRLGIRAVRGKIHRKAFPNEAFPNDQAMRLAREATWSTDRPGLDSHELLAEMNDFLYIANISGQEAELSWDETLWSWFTRDSLSGRSVDHVLPRPVPPTWAERIQKLLNKAEVNLNLGLSVAVNAFWEGGGGRTFSFHDVRGTLPQRSFLAHDTFTGSTFWVAEKQLLQGTWPGFSRRALLCAVIG